MKVADTLAGSVNPDASRLRVDSTAGSKFRDELLRAQRSSSPGALPAGMANAGVTTSYVVKPGDTMTAIARQWIENNGGDASGGAISRVVRTLARQNGIENPDVIRPGQLLVLSGRSVESAATAGAEAKLSTRIREAASADKSAAGQTVNPVMEKMLSRAVALQYFDVSQKAAVRQKLLNIAQSYRVQPDDLARVMLMESDGLNPKASNGSCHGVIQFCEGDNRGAASVGYGRNPKAILSLGVLDQLDLVRRYFDETGLKNMAPASLDDLYLTVLKPAARAQRDPNANLEIPGAQALALYPGNDRSQPITRTSLVAGLHRVAREKLGTSKDGPMPIDTAAVKNVPIREVSFKQSQAMNGENSL